MIKGRVDSIESFGLVDGPGIRAVVFLSGCHLRCRYCHNPEMWDYGPENYTPQELVAKLKRFKPYFKRNSGGVTFSGGDPLRQPEFLKAVLPLLKQERIHTALDTAGVGIDPKDYEEILSNTDLVILDIKHTLPTGFNHLTAGDIKDAETFMAIADKMAKPFWIRQVIIPGLTDYRDYLISLSQYIKRLHNVQRIDFLPYHKLGQEKYHTLKIDYPYENKPAMDEAKTAALYKEFLEIHKQA